MFKKSKFKYSILFLLIFSLFLSISVPVFAETVEEPNLKEVLFMAEYPIDFYHAIVVTATSEETGYLYSCTLTSETNYEARKHLHYGKYSISASISLVETDAKDGTSYTVIPAVDTLIVEESSYIVALGLKVEGFTDTDTEPGPDNNGEGNSSQNGQASTDKTESSVNSSNNSGSNSNSSNSSGNAQKPDSSDNNPTNPNIKSNAEKKADLIKSLVVSALAIIVFFIGGCMYRQHKEG
jgi:hypothetical protein